MERAEVLKRVIGILTEAQDIRRAVETGQDGTGNGEGTVPARGTVSATSPPRPPGWPRRS
ncbi:hypothetical protein WKI68_04185 [Streptomyces sp. MS1.HAVA.3]|uniref:Uncharacterized protein n=1 Tax=Streptomyces caledonius TaxID=3134107 RepID=A0ABU8TZ43_9ACTN